MIWRRHRYVEESRTFTGKGERGNFGSSPIDRIAFGVTVIVDRCECGERKVTEVLGEVKKP